MNAWAGLLRGAWALRVTGLVGVLIEARERGLLADAESVLEALHQRAGFWLSEELRRMVTAP